MYIQINVTILYMERSEPVFHKKVEQKVISSESDIGMPLIPLIQKPICEDFFPAYPICSLKGTRIHLINIFFFIFGFTFFFLSCY